MQRRMDVEMEEGEKMMVVEENVLGRIEMGERVVEERFEDRWRVRIGGRVINEEEFRMGNDVGEELKENEVEGGECEMDKVMMV